MGVMWTVWPLDDDMKAWLYQLDIDYPDVPSRFPTGGEINRVLNALAGYNVKILENGIGGPWHATITPKGEPTESGHCSEWAHLIVREYMGADLQQKLFFEKGCESLIKKILLELSKDAGPLVLIDDAGPSPQVLNYQS